jgi:hypothetical protein
MSGLKTVAVPASHAGACASTSRPTVSGLQHFGDKGALFRRRASEIRQVEIVLAANRPTGELIDPAGRATDPGPPLPAGSSFWHAPSI